MNFLSSKTGRIILFTYLYASEGAPIGFIWWTLPTKLRALGMPVEEITSITTVLILPWAFKFVWSPLIDTFQTRRWTLRSWIFTFQLLMGITLVPFVLFPFEKTFPFILPLLFLHAFFASSQDASIDALAISEVPSNEQGSINGWMQAGMLVGRSLFGGGALVIMSSVGEQAIIAFLIILIWFSSFLLFFSKETRSFERRRTSLSSFVLKFKETGRKPSLWWGLVFAAIAGTAYESVGAVGGPFLIDSGLSSEQIGFFFSFPAVIGMAAGALTGGRAADRFGTRRTVSFFLVLMAAFVILLSAASEFTGSVEAVITVFSCLYVAIGLFTASSYALFMSITDRQLGATQFSAYMGMTNVCESWSAFTVGRLTAAIGYSAAFAIMGIVSLFTLPVVRKLKKSSPQPS